MRKNINSHSGRVFGDRKWILPFFATVTVSVMLSLTAIFGLYTSPYAGEQLPFDVISLARSEDSSGYFIEPDLKRSLET